MGRSANQETQWSEVLQRSVETRVRSVQEKLSIAFTFCSTVEIELKYGHADRARQLLHKVRSTVDALSDHIHNPEHVFGKRSKEFRDQLVQIRTRLNVLESRIEQR